MSGIAAITNHQARIDDCKDQASRLLRTVLDELATPGNHNERIVKLKSVNGVVQASVTSTENYRWDIPTRK